MILAGDAGGTKVRLALFEEKDGKLVRGKTETFASRNFSGIAEILRVYLDEYPISVSRAAIGVPGPIVQGVAHPTNLPWKVREKEIGKTLGIDQVKLVNDLVATTASVGLLTSDELFVLHKGNPSGNEERFAVLAPGTGLGQGFLFQDQKTGKFQVFASEGGHTDFAPTTEIEVELLHYLHEKFKRVSYERVLSGKGLFNIYTFLKETGKASEPQELYERLQQSDAPAVISKCAIAKEFEICVKALDIFVSIMGAQAGNLVLTFLATGGVYLGGGIPPKIIEKLADGKIVSAYLNKGRLANFMAKTPLYVIRDDRAALLGAASIASKL